MLVEVSTNFSSVHPGFCSGRGIIFDILVINHILICLCSERETALISIPPKSIVTSGLRTNTVL